MKVRVVRFNVRDILSVHKDYDDSDSERLQRDSFVVRHTELIRSTSLEDMEDEDDHDLYCKHHEPFEGRCRPK